MIEAIGVGGQVSFDGQYVTITRKGFLARTTVGKGEKRIPLSQISAIQWKRPGPLVNGFVQFTVPGGVEARSSFGSQTASASRDENSVTFDRKRIPEFEALREAVEDAIAALRQPAPQGQAPAPLSLADELTKLGVLLRDGLLTQEEFDAQKARLLAG
ncbi:MULTISPECIES: DUF4429 domain-containing protein [unclassified Streptomyces]|uniref:DUF4429 domain-containing protein n=1 Tax=unclassified Streptomyces TaxID=2593676 RepID=UPI0002000A2E|nr:MULTISPECIES: DUF4429 domain-containing protein [unclassified Streptomyces]MYQ58952.1 DUF4429 domain-containing protein [Streptomyces sp. SID4926]SCD71778.1 Short C-terminal domain-containing protein [Streptomyces sp. DfronAA-171]